MSAPETYFGPWEGPKALWSSGLSPLVLGRPAVSEQMLVSFSPSDQDYLNALEAFAGFERGIYAGLDVGSGQKAA